MNFCGFKGINIPTEQLTDPIPVPVSIRFEPLYLSCAQYVYISVVPIKYCHKIMLFMENNDSSRHQSSHAIHLFATLNLLLIGLITPAKHEPNINDRRFMTILPQVHGIHIQYDSIYPLVGSKSFQIVKCVTPVEGFFKVVIDYYLSQIVSKNV